MPHTTKSREPDSEFTKVGRGGTWEHPVWLGSLGFFLGGRCVHPRSLGLLWFALVALGSSGVTGFTQVRHRVVEFTRVGLGVVRFTQVVGFTRDRSRSRKVHPGSLCSVGFALGVGWFIRGCWVDSGSLWG